MSVKTELKKLAGKFKAQAERAKKEGVGVQPGDYTARLDSGEVYSTGSGLRCKLAFTCVDEGADEEGQTIPYNAGLDNSEDAFVYFCGDMARMGVDPDALAEDVEAEVAALVARHPVVALKVTDKNGYLNTRIGAMIEESSDGAEEAEEGAEEAEEGTLDVGSRITFTFKGEADAGEVTELVDEDTIKVRRDSNNRVATIKVSKNDVQFETSDEDAEEAEEEEAEEEEAEEEEAPAEEEEGMALAVGMKVEFPWKGVQETGVVTEIPNDTQAKVKKDSDGKIATVKIENLVALLDEGTDAEEEAEEEEEEEAPAPPVKKPAATKPAAGKPAPKPAAGKPGIKPRGK